MSYGVGNFLAERLRPAIRCEADSFHSNRITLEPSRPRHLYPPISIYTPEDEPKSQCYLTELAGHDPRFEHRNKRRRQERDFLLSSNP
jgi:hypothetical protein